MVVRRSEHEHVKEAVRRLSFAFGMLMWSGAGLIWLWQSSPSPRALARAVPIAAASDNPYWAGWVATQNGPYSAVRATWTVPAMPCSATGGSNATTYIWVGEGGYLRGIASNLIQAGTASDCIDGVERYHAFYEWYPGIFATDFPLTIHPGDTVAVTIDQTEVNYWTLSIRDETTGLQSTTATLYAADTGSAEFVVERPMLCTGWNCGQVQLGKFGQVTFLDAQTWSAPAYAFTNVSAAQPVALHDPVTNRVLAQPGRLVSPAPALPVLWRSG